MKEEKTITNLKERVENFHNSEIELKSAIIDEIKSEFEKYHSDKVYLFVDDEECRIDEDGYNEWYDFKFDIVHFDHYGSGEMLYPTSIERDKNGLFLNLVDCSEIYPIYDESPELTVDMLYSILKMLQLPIIKKINRVDYNLIREFY